LLLVLACHASKLSGIEANNRKPLFYKIVISRPKKAKVKTVR
jgi:hypothetical protein